MDINTLKSFTTRNTSMDTLIGVRSDLKSLAANYNDLSLDVPQWVSDKITEVEVEISFQSKAEKMANLAKMKSRRAALMTADEKRVDLDKQIAALEASMK